MTRITRLISNLKNFYEPCFDIVNLKLKKYLKDENSL